MCIVERNGRCHKSPRLGAGNDKDESTRNKTGVGITRVSCKVTGLNTDRWYVQSWLAQFVNTYINPHMKAHDAVNNLLPPA